jgi:putative membrane protein
MGGMSPGREYRFLLPAILACYAGARVLQVITGPTPRLSLVALDVLSAAAFALLDGARHYGRRGILVFAGICLAVGNGVENIGIATGFPFGHYRFLEVMGPRFLSVPILLGMAYIGMATFLGRWRGF